MSAKVEKLVKLYKTLSRTQVLTGGKISESGLSINTFWTQRDIEKGKYIKFSKNHVVNSKLEKISDSIPFDTTNELISAFGPSEKLRAVIREISNGKDERKQYLEIWNNAFLMSTVDLTTLDIHGNVYTDVDFGALEWSPDESKVLYIAEKKLPKREPFYKRKPEKSEKSAEGDNTPPSKGEEYVYRQEWGEQNVGKVESVIAVYDIKEDSVKILEGLPENTCPGQVIWSPDGSKVVGIVWDTFPRKLGIVYCTNRPSKIFSLDLHGNYCEISENDRSVQSPIFSPDGKYLLWFENRIGGPHRSAMALKKLEYSEDCLKSHPTTLINVIEDKISTANNKTFYGLYNVKFPRRCWANDGKRLIFSTTQKYQIKSYVLNIENSDLVEIENDSEESFMIFDVKNDKILASKKSYMATDKVLIGILPEVGNENGILWKIIQEPRSIEGLENFFYTYLNFSHNNNDSVTKFNAIYFGPKNGKDLSVPLIVWPHGGPHSSYFNTFSLESSFLANLGFAMLFVNYRGSLGMGQKNIDFLPGKVGNTDVKDCVYATTEALKEFPWLDPNKLVLNGGSHGGFLVHHLSGQYPDMFKAVLSRNPVTDIASMSITSDIPDWCAVEAGSEYTQKGEVNDELFIKMRKASPIQYVHRVKAPTYLMIGAKDLRVPASQGIEFYNRLKANNVPVKMNLYDDNHPLGNVPNEMDNLINGGLWLLEHTS